MDYTIATLLRSLLNDLKRRPEDAARELEIPTEEIHQYLSGERPFPSALVQKACEVWPVSPREFALVLDDAPTGLKIMKAEASEKSARVMERKGRPYYEYRDTAASSLSIFRPEWIKELCEVDHNDPEHPLAQWNNGHFMHQFTYFVGPVNFYYRGDDGKKKVAVMNTGDSMYIRPFVPHTFATRKSEGGGGLILALTYGGDLLGDAQQELRAVSSPLARQFALAYDTPSAAVGSLIEYFLNCHAMPIEELSRRTQIPAAELDSLIAGETPVDDPTLRKVASALGVRLRDLLAYDESVPSTIVLPSNKIASWLLITSQGRYTVRELASTPHMPMSKSLHIAVEQQGCQDFGLRTGLHQYLYNVGTEPIEIAWRLPGEAPPNTALLEPGDSAFMKPFVEHSFNSPGQAGELISLRIPSKISGDPLRELSVLGGENVDRVANDPMPWFDKCGKQ